MLQLKASVLNVYKTPVGKTKEGGAYGGEDKVQFQFESRLKNGEKRIEIITLSTKQPEKFRGALGEEVVVDVGAFPNNGGITYFMPPDCTVTKSGKGAGVKI
jgi:hypothetical protein